MKKEINVFIISPADVNKERAIAKEVCLELNNVAGHDVDINPVLWEYYPMSYHKNAQANIDIELDKCDIFIVILWHRIGSIVEGYEGAITKSKNVTGTQYEIEKILATKKEAVFFYFKTQEKKFSSSELIEASKQRELLDIFLGNINLTKGSTKHGYHEFEDTDMFRKKLREHLMIEIEKQTEINFSHFKNTKMNIFYIRILLSLAVLLSVFILYPEKDDNFISSTVMSAIDQTIMTFNTKKDGITVYLEMQNSDNHDADKQTYHYFLDVLTHVDIKVLSNKSKSDFTIVLESNTIDTHYMISEIEMIKVGCTLSYTVIDLGTNTIIDTKSIRGESTHFVSQEGEKECLSTLYLDLSKSLKTVFVGT